MWGARGRLLVTGDREQGKAKPVPQRTRRTNEECIHILRNPTAPYLAFTGTLSFRFSHSRTRSAESSLFLSKEMVNCSTGRGSGDFCKSTRSRSWLSSYCVPH